MHADPSSDPRLIRISVGVEDLEASTLVRGRGRCLTPALQDLKDDLRRAFQEMARAPKAKL